ncbi:MAG TPA: four helix bundle protein [Bacteroidales bacterium]|nr:four helix bundle protein [Bacteroidales bacterium]
MALVYDLQVYKCSYDLIIKIYNIVKNYNREYKYTIGEQLKNETLHLIMDIYRANVSNQKDKHIQNAREELEIVKLLLRLSKDLKLINIKNYSDISLLIENISKQLTGWQKYINTKK